MKPNKENKMQFDNNVNMLGSCRDTINELRKEIKHLMKRDTSDITSQIIEERDLLV